MNKLFDISNHWLDLVLCVDINGASVLILDFELSVCRIIVFYGLKFQGNWRKLLKLVIIRAEFTTWNIHFSIVNKVKLSYVKSLKVNLARLPFEAAVMHHRKAVSYSKCWWNPPSSRWEEFSSSVTSHVWLHQTRVRTSDCPVNWKSELPKSFLFPHSKPVLFSHWSLSLMAALKINSAFNWLSHPFSFWI